ncbi:MAG: inorganic phosphate transporter [Gammaproteobacteria bacterium]|nr:inorganic phosphate transporter [Gammaproteobacteria bacterium]
MEIIEHYGLILLVLAVAFGFFMAWGVGANDVANAMGTSVGAGALTIKQAVIIAAVFEFAGAYLAGGQVTSTIRRSIIDPAIFSDSPELLVYGMIAALLAAGIWLLIASLNGWPVSTTHSIVGSIVGFAAVGIGFDAVNWGRVGTIVLSWVTSPLCAGILAFVLFRSVQVLILDKDDPFERAKKYIPYYMFLVGFVMAMVTFLKGLSHVGLELSFLDATTYSAGVGFIVVIIGMILLRNIKVDKNADRDFHYASVEKVFAVLMIFTACGMAFAHGSNDVANAIGPLAAVNSVIASGGVITSQAPIPVWILALGGGGIALGLIMYGHKVIATIGKGITHLTPSRGFAAELAAGTTVVIASGTGMPISTTHTLVGAVLGVGFARGIAAINLRVIRTIFISWVITLPAGAILAIIIFYILKAVFG